MSTPRFSLRQLISVVSPVLGGLLCACSAPAEDEASGPPAFNDSFSNQPRTSGAAGAPSTPANPANPAVPSPNPSTNEGTPPEQLPVTNNSNNNAAGTAGAGGAPSMGNANPTPPVGVAGMPNMPVPQPPDPMQPAPQDPTPMLPTPPGDAFFFDDFEAGAPGTQPAAWNRWINYTTAAGNALGNPQFALLDDTEARSGNQSVHFHATGATQPAMLTLALPANMSRIHIRAFVKSSIAVGGVAADAVSNHESLIGLRATPNDGNDEIRFGGAKGALGFNMVGPGRNDAVAPVRELWGSAPGMQPNQWHCVELAFINEGTPRATAALDGTVVRDVTSIAGWHIPVDQAWLNGLYNEVFIGWQSFSPQPGNDVWMDDVILSTQPIGCN